MAYLSSPLFAFAVTAVKYLVSGCLVMVVGMVGGTRLVSPQGPSDPFLLYEAILLEQSADNKLCDAQWHDPATSQSVCKIVPTSRIFDEINLFHDDADPLRLDIAFWSEQLRVADLVLRWGRPDTIRWEGSRYVLDWQQPLVQAYTGPVQRFNYLAFVPLVQWHRSGRNAEEQ